MFRLLLIHAGLVALAATLAMGYVFWHTSIYSARQLADATHAEILGLAEQYRQGGLPLLRQAVAQRSAAPGAGLYLIADNNGERVAGNLGAPSPALLSESGYVQFRYSAGTAGAPETRLAIAQVLRLEDGYRLVVGRDIEDRRTLERIFIDAVAWGIGLIALIGVLGGLLVSRVLLRRIRAISDTSQRIMHGDLSQRVPVAGTGDELDRLAGSLNAMLERIEQLVGGLREVSDNIAHDLKTPLTRMRNRIDTALREPPDQTAYRDTLIQTIEEADDLIRTFNALLSIARLEAGARVDDMETCDLAAVARDAVELYDPVAEGEGIALVSRARGHAPVNANRQLLAQAAANLIDNAIKYARPGPARGAAITVTVERADSLVRLIVADNGPGIPEDQRAHALKRFTRLETSRSRPGSGLGLSLVAAVARLHGGAVMLEDNRPGLRVVVSLPAAQTGKALT